jgi:thiol-activated cytolysin
MKKSILRLSAFVLISTALVNCSKKDDATTTDSASNLAKVAFVTEPTKNLSTAKTGATKVNPATGKSEVEYLVKVEESKAINPTLIFDAQQSNDIIYPGSILRGSSFMKGNYDPLVLSTPFNNVILSVSLKGQDFPGSVSTRPVLSEIRTSLSSFLFKNVNGASYDPAKVPADYVYQSDSIYSSNTFAKSLSVHAKADVLSGLITADFSYSSSSTSTNSKKYVMVKVRQSFYNASIDPKFQANWINGDIKGSECGTHEPVYISSVDYGRIAYLLIETDLSTEEVSKMVNAAVGVKFLKWGASAEVAYSEKFTKLWGSNSIKIKVLGGPAKLVTSYAGFMNYLVAPSNQELVDTSIPISYKVRRLLDNTQVDVVGRFEKEFKVYKPE